ncbi:MAG: hypothetical protein WCP36_11535 [Methanomicrobiales archaeon]
MQLGVRREIFLITLFIVLCALVSSSGCIQPTNQGPGTGQGPSSIPQSTPVPAGQGTAGQNTAMVTPQNTQIGGMTNQSNNQTMANTTSGPKYAAGSSVQKSPADSSYDKDRGWVIVKVNDDDTYTVGQIYFDPEVKVWFKVREERVVTRVIHAVERDYPVLNGLVDWNSYPTKHGVVDQYGTTRLEW